MYMYYLSAILLVVPISLVCCSTTLDPLPFNATLTPYLHRSDRILKEEVVVFDIIDFAPLSCNDDILLENESDDGSLCTSTWTSSFGTADTFNDRIVIPCGVCIVMDRDDVTLTLLDGIDIIGKLFIPTTIRQLKVITPVVIVQGELHIDSTTKPVNGIPSIQFLLTGDTDKYFYPYSTNSNNCGLNQACIAGLRSIMVAGGRMNVHGLPPETPTWVPLHDVRDVSNGKTNILIVSKAIVEKWDVGAEILITSHLLDYTAQKVRRIVSISDTYDNKDYVQIELDRSIPRPTTYVDSYGNFPVEVALLSRNIVWDIIDAADQIDTALSGHFWIYHTPNVKQYIEGIEIVHFGQRGNVGRYPIHFHFCSSVLGSIVSKNTIRQSSQRCVVVHGTDRLIVQDNIAYDTKGHCFITEDGIETGNHFIGNLGALTHNQDKVNLEDDTDDRASTFWITNPTNIFYGNVAAGSESIGFWIEPLKRGLRKSLYPDIKPERDRLLLFKNNIAHSNADFGIRTYPNGYNPSDIDGATLEGLKVYRNYGGIFIHGSRAIMVKDSLFADNHRINIDIDKESDGGSVRNTTVIGLSDSYKFILEIQYDYNTTEVRANVCSAGDDDYGDSIIGIDIFSAQRISSEANTILEDITMYGFANTPCDSALPFRVSENDNYVDRPFDTLPTLTRVNVLDAEVLINLCNDKIMNVYVTLLDDSSNPSTLLQYNESMIAFIDPNECSEEFDYCYIICDRTCFTTTVLQIDPMSTENYTLSVCQVEDEFNCVLVEGATRFINYAAVTYREYLFHLPSGNYTAVFFDENEEQVWPNFVSIVYEPSVCPDEYSRAQIEVIQPPVDSTQCQELVRNGNLEDADENDSSIPRFWVQRDYTDLTLSPGDGVSGSNAAKIGSSEGDVILMQYIDQRCIQLLIGQSYTLTAHIKMFLTKTGESIQCDPATTVDVTTCPEIGIAVELSSGNIDYITAAQVSYDVDSTDNGYQVATGNFQMVNDVNFSSRIYFYVWSEYKTTLLVDNVSMTLNTN